MVKLVAVGCCCFADLDLLLSWLEGARDGSQARDGAATIFGAWCVSCIHFAYARYDAKAVAVVDFLLRVTAARPDAPKRLAAALLSADVLEVLTDLQEPLSEALRLILPKQAWQTDVTRWSDEWSHGLAPAWNAAVARHIEKPRISEPQRYFVPALVLVAWCDVFEESPAVLEQLAAELLATEGELEREIRAWFDVLIEVMTISAKHIAGLESLSRPDRAKLFGPASARSKPIKSFRSRLTRRAPPVEADP